MPKPLLRSFLTLLLALALSVTAQSAAQSMTQNAFDLGIELEVELVAEGLTSPLFLESPPDGSGRRFIVDQVGRIFILTPEGERLEEPFLDMSDRMVTLLEGFEERGLLGVAFHPNYALNGRFYVHYSAPLGAGAPAGWDHTSRISEFLVSADDPDRADPDKERIILEVHQPNQKTNGGALAFGPDGYLYISMGEGGGAHGLGEVLYDALEVPEENNVWDFLAQDITTLYGKILRLDVDRGWPTYAVPRDNPFVGDYGRDEIFAWGFRNHYRMAFDRGGDHDLLVAAVGEALWETVYLVDGPGNFGWPIKEGSHCYDRQRPLDPPESCPATGPEGWTIRDPIIEYGNLNLLNDLAEVDAEPVGTAIIGAYVYRGSAIPELYGKLVFGDYSADPRNPSAQVFVATPPQAVGERWPFQKVLEFEGLAQSMGQDAEGELYILTNNTFGPYGDTGKVYKLVPRRDAVVLARVRFGDADQYQVPFQAPLLRSKSARVHEVLRSAGIPSDPQRVHGASRGNGYKEGREQTPSLLTRSTQ